MRKQHKTKIMKVYNHVKKHMTTYIFISILLWIGVQIYKMILDDGTNKNGDPYYEEFEEPESEDYDEKR